MTDELLGLALFGSLGSVVVMVWTRTRDQAHERRVQERLDATRHMAAVVRAHFAEQRRAA